jgi:hypothetical protein
MFVADRLREESAVEDCFREIDYWKQIAAVSENRFREGCHAQWLLPQALGHNNKLQNNIIA